MRYYLRSLILVLALLLIAPAFVPPAFAHAILEASEPKSGATIAAGDVAFALTYNSRIDATRSALTLSLPDQSKSKLTVAAGATPNILTSTAHLAPGKYLLHWQVLSLDGHITRGQIAFTVQGG